MNYNISSHLQDTLGQLRSKLQELVLAEGASNAAFKDEQSPSSNNLLYVLKCDKKSLLKIDLQLLTSLAGSDSNKPVTFNELLLGRDDSANSYDIVTAKYWQSLNIPSSGMLTDVEDAEMAALFLKRIFSSGRCHYQNAINPPLSIGPELVGKLAWVSLAGSYELSLVIDGPSTEVEIRTFVFAAPWYLDMSNSQVGLIRVNAAPGLLKAIAKFPSVTAYQVTSMHAWLDQHAPDTIPRPLPGLKTEVTLVPPLLKLRLETNHVKTDCGETRRVDRAVLDVQFPGLPKNHKGQSQETLLCMDKNLPFADPI